MIVTLIGVVFTFVTNIFQSVKSGHFKSKCGENTMEMGMHGQERESQEK
jgi:hypothetical protein